MFVDEFCQHWIYVCNERTLWAMRKTKVCSLHESGTVLRHFPVLLVDIVLLNTALSSQRRSAFAFVISLPFQLKHSEGLHTIICPSLRIAICTRSYMRFFHNGGQCLMDVLCGMYTATINPCPVHVCQRRICLYTQKQMRTFICRTRKIRIYSTLQT